MGRQRHLPAPSAKSALVQEPTNELYMWQAAWDLSLGCRIMQFRGPLAGQSQHKTLDRWWPHQTSHWLLVSSLQCVSLLQSAACPPLAHFFALALVTAPRHKLKALLQLTPAATQPTQQKPRRFHTLPYTRGTVFVSVKPPGARGALILSFLPQQHLSLHALRTLRVTRRKHPRIAALLFAQTRSTLLRF